MIGFNGGLIGAQRLPDFAQSVPGAWSLDEQLAGNRLRLWPPSAGDVLFSTTSLGNVVTINNNSVSQLPTLDNLKTLLNLTLFQDKNLNSGYGFNLGTQSGCSWSFSWANFDIATYPNLYLRLQRTSGTNSNWLLSGDGISTASGTVSTTTTSYTIAFTAAKGRATLETTNSSGGLAVQDIALGNASGVFYVTWV